MTKTRRVNRRIWLLVALVGLLLAWVFNRPTEQPTPPRGKPPVAVTLHTVQAATVPVELTTMGHVESMAMVAIKPQVTGIVQRLLCREGSLVQAGDPLIQLDPAVFQQALQQAEARLAQDQAQIRQAEATLKSNQAQVRAAQATVQKDQAQLDLARVEEGRYQALFNQEFVSREQLDQTRTTRLAAQATLDTDRAAINRAMAQTAADQAAIMNARAILRQDQAAAATARLNLSHTVIRAPFQGKVGAIQTPPGSVVQANTSDMITLAKLQPIRVSFTLPEKQLPAVQAAANQQTLPLRVLLPNAGPYTASPPTPLGNLTQPVTAPVPQAAESGQLSFIDNTVDPTTGSIRLFGAFANAGLRLWPGQYVTLILRLGQRQNVLLVPNRAVLNGQNGAYVFVAQQGKAVTRPVVTGLTVGESVVVDRGLQPGEQVVVDGQQLLEPGAAIRMGGRPAAGKGASPSPSESRPR